VHPDGVGVAADEFVDRKSVDRRRPPDALSGFLGENARCDAESRASRGNIDESAEL
jgi:hypothetical protein